MEKEKHNDNNKDRDFSCENCHEEHNTNAKPERKKEFDAPNALIAVMVVLVVMAGVQVFQTQKLLGAVLSGAVKASAETQGSSIGLPSQVGGCG